MNFRTALTTAVVAALPFVAAPALAQEESPSASTVLATVNGTQITLGHVVALRGQLPEQYQALPDEILFNGILDQLIQQEVLEQYMQGQIDKRMELAIENEKRAFIANEAINRLSAIEVSDEQVQAAYDAQYGSVEPELEFNAAHILVETEEAAAALVEQLEGGANFAELAKEHSTGPSGPNGGALGWFGKGMMVEPFENAILSLEPGQVGGPVQTQFGWHVVKLNETRNKPVPTLDEVRADLTAEVQRANLEAEIQALTDAAQVDRADHGLEASVIRDPGVFESE